MKKILAALFVLLFSSAVARAEFKAGAAKVVISPPVGSWMGGYLPAPRSTGVHDDVHVRCLVMSDSAGASYAMISLEIVGLFKADVDKMISAASQKSGIPESNFLVGSIHTHKGPDVMGIWGGMPPAYFRKFYDAAASCVTDAQASEKPARIVFSEADAGTFNHNRRHGGAPVDRMLRVMQFRDADDNPFITVVNYAAHPVILPFDASLISADYVGALNAAIEKKTGGASMFFLAAAGDVNPDFDPSQKIAGTEEPYAVAAAMGNSLADIALKAATSPKVTVVKDPKIAMKDVLFSFPVENKQVKMILQSGLARIRLHGNNADGRFSVLRIGPADIVAAPFELSTSVWEGARAHIKAPIRWVVTFGQGYFGYVVPDDDYKEGDYESGLSLGPKTGSSIIKSLGDAFDAESK